MPDLNDREYYARREAQQRVLAASARNAAVAAIHNGMADEYAKLVEAAVAPLAADGRR